MKQYHEHLELILSRGSIKKPAREGMPGSTSLFGHQNRYDLSKGFPLLTTKKVNFKHIVVELLWFLKGDSNIKYLVDNGCNIWNEDAYNYYSKLYDKRPDVRYPQNKFDFKEFQEILKERDKESLFKMQNIRNPNSGAFYTLGDTGSQYPWLWRSWGEDRAYEDGYHDKVDQVKELIEGLKSNPMGRRHIITAWNPATLDDMALNACHAFVQFNCRELSPTSRNKHYRNRRWVKVSTDLSEYRKVVKDGNVIESELEKYNVPKYYLDCQLYQRSADMFLGVPYNIASYALLTEIIAQITGMVAGDFIHTFGDSHIYDNHLDQVNDILNRDPEKYALPKLKINRTDLSDFYLEYFENPNWEDFELEGYEHYPAIKAKLSTGLK